MEMKDEDEGKGLVRDEGFQSRQGAYSVWNG